MATIYLAAGLFNIGERERNIRLEEALMRLGHKVILPQREALKFFDEKTGKFNVDSIVEDCQKMCSLPEVICVVCADGPNVDDGTSVEYGMAISKTGRAIVYRTDFRTALDREVGVNAMLMAKGTIFIYHPCFITKIEEVQDFYESLARKIDEAIRNVK